MPRILWISIVNIVIYINKLHQCLPRGSEKQPLMILSGCYVFPTCQSVKHHIFLISPIELTCKPTSFAILDLRVAKILINEPPHPHPPKENPFCGTFKLNRSMAFSVYLYFLNKPSCSLPGISMLFASFVRGMNLRNSWSVLV